MNLMFWSTIGALIFPLLLGSDVTQPGTDVTLMEPCEIGPICVSIASYV